MYSMAQKGRDLSNRNRAEGSGVLRTEIINTVKNIRRRYALYYLDQCNDQTASVSDIAEQVAAWEYETSPDAISRARRKSVYNSLIQTHLPKLEELRIVNFDADAGTATLTSRGEDIDIYLVDDSTTIRWPQTYLGLGGGSLLSIVLNALGVTPFAMVQLSVLAGIFALFLCVVAVAHWHKIHWWGQKRENAPPDFRLKISNE